MMSMTNRKCFFYILLNPLSVVALNIYISIRYLLCLFSSPIRICCHIETSFVALNKLMKRIAIVTKLPIRHPTCLNVSAIFGVLYTNLRGLPSGLLLRKV